MCLTFAPEGDIILDIKLMCLQLWREILFPSSEDLQDVHERAQSALRLSAQRMMPTENCFPIGTQTQLSTGNVILSAKTRGFHTQLDEGPETP